MPTHRSPKPAFPASWRVDPERLEETLNHLLVTYTSPLPTITFLPVSRLVRLNPEAADHKDWKRGTGQSPCFSWVIYLFMEALLQPLLSEQASLRKHNGVTPVSLQTQDFLLLCCRWDQLEDDYKTGEVNRGLEASACQRVDLTPKTVNFLRLCSRCRTWTGRQPREDANSAAGVFALKTLAKPSST